MNVKDIVVSRILDQLEKGTPPWKQPWFNVGKGNINGHVYTGLNRLLLADCQDQYYMTFNQALGLGGAVKKGEKGKQVVFWKQLKIEKEKDGEIEEKNIPFLRYYTVFGLSQVSLPQAAIDKIKMVRFNNNQVMDSPEALAAKTGADIRHNDGTRAFYDPMNDYVNMPLIGQFTDSQAYYATLFHELAHWTGGPKRLNRIDMIAARGGQVYAKEELTAEITAAMLCHDFQIKDNNAAGYCESWLHALQNDRNMIFYAAGRSQKAYEYLNQ